MINVNLEAMVKQFSVCVSPVGSGHLTKVTSRKDALHWVLDCVLVCGGAGLIAGCAQVVVDANQTFVSSSSKIIF